ncbi:MAG: FecR domain-containing protein [Pedobacter sp.]|uniref:FecR family protein n=1 Tax=Pedobacter sp. TaxID=1411316 RepID=UPI0035654AB5
MNYEDNPQKYEIHQRLRNLNFTEGDVTQKELLNEQLQSKRELRSSLLPIERKYSNRRIWMAAASVVLLIAAALLWPRLIAEKSDIPTSLAYGQIRTNKGERKILILADGSKVTMNSASILTYPLTFKKGNREVKLQGQAFFEVKRDTSHPFIVRTSKLAVKVLGTSFDVSNYNHEEELSVTVRSGKVSVQEDLKTEKHILLEGDRLVYHTKNGSVNRQRFQPEEYISWQQGHYVFEDKTLSYICQQLEKVYDMKFHFQDHDLKLKKMGFRIRGENIVSVMDMLSLAGGFSYTIKNKQITLKYK